MVQPYKIVVLTLLLLNFKYNIIIKSISQSMYHPKLDLQCVKPICPPPKPHIELTPGPSYNLTQLTFHVLYAPKMSHGHDTHAM